MNEKNDSQRYAGRVQEEVQRYLREVLDENNKLRGLLAGLRTENLSLSEDVTRLREEVEQHRRRQANLHHQLIEVEAAAARHTLQHSAIEEQNSNLANLYVASYQLASTIDRDLVLQAIQEIVANLIGSETMAIYERGSDDTHLVLACSIGIDPLRHARVAIGDGKIGRAAESGELYVSPTGRSDDDHITACIPLRIEGRTIAAIVIFELLDHKPVLEQVDRELFDLLGVHAAMALHCATLHRRAMVEV